MTKVKHLPFKRLFDLAFSATALTCLSPVFLGIAVAVKVSSPGPVFFSQLRVGRGGRLFRCYKFRTMCVNAEDELKKLLCTDPELAAEWAAKHKLTRDPRITSLGRFLRRSCLDELPQFWNVLRGDLSVVGPRALVRDEVRDRLGDRAAKILSIRPGLTGIWQTSGRSNTSYCRRIRLDERYVDHRNFLMDLRLIARTVPVIFTAKGAY